MRWPSGHQKGIKPAGVSGQVSYRDEVLDVRPHIEIAARRIDLEGREISTYRELGGKRRVLAQKLERAGAIRFI